MRDILAPSNSQWLRQLAAGRLLVAFDYDGTLAPVVADPRRARMRPLTQALLRRVAHAYPCAVITGRARNAVAPLLAGVGIEYVIGNHGAEWPGDGSRAADEVRLVRRWKKRLMPALHGMGGLRLEDKGLSLTVHFRGLPERRALRAQLVDQLRGLPDCRVVPGIESLNLIPREALDKGEALQRLRAMSGCRAALYVGDDDTDETVFRLKSAAVTSVRVGRKRGSSARYFLTAQNAVDRLLRLLYQARFEGIGQR